MSTVFSSISMSKIAPVSLGQDVSFSLQVPPLTSTSHLPGPTDKAYPGLWLTSAPSGIPPDETGADLNDALLLLDSEAATLRDIKASGGLLAPMLTHYIRCSRPTKSFAQISASSGIPLPTIQMLANHLVYWRRARAIPPIRQRDTYIVSPNCDLSKLGVATAAYEAAFPALPSLPKMLSLLSGTPRPYGSFIPSKGHKDTYFSVLAWLLRGGWVTQLRSFARVKVCPEIKVAVERALRKEEIEKYIPSEQGSTIPAHSDDKDIDDDNGSISDDDGDDDDGDNMSDIGIGHDHAGSSSSSSLTSHNSADDRADPTSQGHNLDTLGDHELSRNSAHSILDKNVLLSMSSLILSPHRATPLESRWLDEIMSRFPESNELTVDDNNNGIQSGNAGNNNTDIEDTGLHTSLKTYWPSFVKYFNGIDAVEKIPVRQGLKRKIAWQVLARMGVVTGQVGSFDSDPREHVLVGVRHW